MSERINWDRMCEIATMALRRLEEIDKDSAWEFYMSEIEMDADELAFFELHRNRKAVNIQWCKGGDIEYNLPEEVDIPDEVDTDDITYFLEEKYENAYVVDYEIEEDEE